MKNLISVFFTFLLIVIMGACNQSAQDVLPGEWQISDLKTTSDIPEDQMEAYNEQIEEMKNSSKIVFEKDGTFEQTILDETSEGNWEINKDETVLTTTIDGNKEVKTIIELSPEKIVLQLAFDSDTTTTTLQKVK